MNDLIYDGILENENEILYYFVSKDIESASKLFMELYEEDIMDYAFEHISLDIEDAGYTVNGCTICLVFDKKVNKVDSVTITASIESNGEFIDIEPADIELDDECIKILLNKVEIKKLFGG